MEQTPTQNYLQLSDENQSKQDETKMSFKHKSY